MAAKTTTIDIPNVATFEAPREHQSYRLDPRILAIVEDIAQGVEAGESGLKSCTLGAVAASTAGADDKEVNRRHHRETEIIEDEDECFNAIGDLLAAGFSPEEVAKQVSLGGGATHLLALERWCDRVRLSCDRDDAPATELAGYRWRGGALHERRRRGHRAMAALRSEPAGVTHASVLHVVYGWADPFVESLPAEVRVALGKEFAPLARYTDAVEAKRLELAQHEAVRGASDEDGAIRLAGYRERLAREDRCLSSGDAIRYAVGAFSEPMPVQGDTESLATWEARKEARKGRRLEHEGEIATFITAVRVEANRMLTEASVAFRDAWQGS